MAFIKIQYVFFIIILFTFGINSCGVSEQEKQKLEEKNIAEFYKYDEEEKDLLFIKYKDSLKKYFSPLEISLIRQYKNNHENLNSEDDFYFFYRNAYTLKGILSNRMSKHAERIRRSEISLYPIEWFKELAEGMDITIVHNGLSYGVFFDYEDFHQHADKTEGIADDDFIKLLEMSYIDHSFFPNWVQPISEYKGCSLLGSGLHYQILEKIHRYSKKNTPFKVEIQRVKKDIMNDILGKKVFCAGAKKVVKEINKICNQLDMQENEIKILKMRTKQILENKGKQIQFNVTVKKL